MTIEVSTGWMVPDVPGTGDPAVLRRYLADLRSIQEGDAAVREAIAEAEKDLAALEAEDRPERAA